MMSATVRYGDLALTAMTLGVVDTSAIGTKSRAGSKVMLAYRKGLMLCVPMVPRPSV